MHVCKITIATSLLPRIRNFKYKLNYIPYTYRVLKFVYDVFWSLIISWRLCSNQPLRNCDTMYQNVIQRLILILKSTTRYPSGISSHDPLTPQTELIPLQMYITKKITRLRLCSSSTYVHWLHNKRKADSLIDFKI
jgi:hypothetical protein